MPDLLAEDSDTDDDAPALLRPTRAPPRGARVARHVDDISVACPMEVCGTSAAKGDEDKEFIIDSGCTAHYGGEPQNQLVNFVPRQESISLGNAEHRVHSYGRGLLGPLCDVLYAPGMFFSMVSVSALDERGCYSVFGGGRCVIIGRDYAQGIAALALDLSQEAMITATLRRKLHHVDIGSFGRGDVAAAGLEKEGSGK